MPGVAVYLALLNLSLQCVKSGLRIVQNPICATPNLALRNTNADLHSMQIYTYATRKFALAYAANMNLCIKYIRTCTSRKFSLA